MSRLKEYLKKMSEYVNARYVIHEIICNGIFVHVNRSVFILKKCWIS